MPSRVDRLEKRKKKVVKKVLPKLNEANAAGKGKKADRIAVRGDKKIDRINKKIGKSMARQEKKGMRQYGGSVKTSGMRKKAKKNR